MCGIAGLLDPAGSVPRPRLAELAGAMAQTLAHRGPDDGGVWVDPERGLALGHRRLAVIDPSPAGRQPMASQDGRFVLAYNGELYNAGELRQRLEKRGFSPRSSCDTEVLVECFAAWGVLATLAAADAMFALALYDRASGQLHLARDRCGEKPLYFGWLGRVFAFASELKALRSLPGPSPAVDRQAAGLFLELGYVPAPRSIYQGVSKLEPGQLATLEVSSGPGHPPGLRRYWSARQAVEQARSRPLASSAEAVPAVATALNKAVSRRLVADVGVGALLSGGVDSSLVVALAQDQLVRPLKTFTVALAHPGFDESGPAREVAARLGTDHCQVEVGAAEAAKLVPSLAEVWDEPFADSSQLPTYLVSQVAAQSVTVALSGDGGDELFAGYNRHAWLGPVWGRARWLPLWLRRLVGEGLQRAPAPLGRGAAALARRLPGRWRLAYADTKVAKLGRVLAAGSLPEAYVALLSDWPGTGPPLVDRREPLELTWPQLGTVCEDLLLLDLAGYLPDDILVKLDRASMACSLEARTPYLAPEVVEVAWRLPLECRVRGGSTKWALRQILARYLPPQLTDRPKMGFGVPLGDWLKDELRPWAEELLSARRLRLSGLVDPEPVRRAWAQHLAGRRDWSHQLWNVLVLQAWLERWAPPMRPRP